MQRNYTKICKESLLKLIYKYIKKIYKIRRLSLRPFFFKERLRKTNR